MPGVTGTRVCCPCAPTTVTSLVPDAVVTIAATGTVSTGPSVCPVSTVTRTFSPFSAAGSAEDGVTLTGTNNDEPEPLPVPPEPPDVPADPEPPAPPPTPHEAPAAPDPPDAPEPPDEPEVPDDPELPAELAPPIFTVMPAGSVWVAVLSAATVPAALIPVASSDPKSV